MSDWVGRVLFRLVRERCRCACLLVAVPDEFNYDPVSKSYGEPQRRPEIRSATIEFIAPSEYMVSVRVGCCSTAVAVSSLWLLHCCCCAAVMRGCCHARLWRGASFFPFQIDAHQWLVSLEAIIPFFIIMF